ncbi:MAG: DUF4411 family protein [Alphaproteobacteria bacterium]|nr:DUF4411 family protein [Alphaproteobacteria bacterium]
MASPLSAVTRQTKPWFLKVDDAKTQHAMALVANHVGSSGCRPEAQAKFLSGADPWLVAKAIVTEAKIITHEQPCATAKLRISIPDVCRAFGAEWGAPYDVLRNLAASFTFKAPSP